jgi:hypothetical protein
VNHEHHAATARGRRKEVRGEQRVGVDAEPLEPRHAESPRHRLEQACRQTRGVLGQVRRDALEEPPAPEQTSRVQVPGHVLGKRVGRGEVPDDLAGVLADARLASSSAGRASIAMRTFAQSTSTWLWSPTTSRWIPARPECLSSAPRPRIEPVTVRTPSILEPSIAIESCTTLPLTTQPEERDTFGPMVESSTSAPAPTIAGPTTRERTTFAPTSTTTTPSSRDSIDLHSVDARREY